MLDRLVLGTLVLRPVSPDHLELVEANPTALAQLGGVREELLGSGWVDRLAPIDHWRLVAAAREVLAGEADGCQVEITAWSGRRVRVCLDLLDAGPGTDGPLVLAQLTEHPGNELTSAFSQQLQNPVAGILGYAELLREGAAGELNHSQLALLARVEGNAQQLLGLAELLLSLERLDAGEVDIATGDVRLDDVVRSAVESLGLAGRGLDLALNARAALGPLVVRGDGAALERVVLELLTNAVKFTPTGGRITVALSREGSDVVVAVQDTGPGVPHHEQPRIFDRFFRSSAALAQPAQGTGLGLATVRAVVVAHGGSVGVTSGADGGARFEVRLPVAPAA